MATRRGTAAGIGQPHVRQACSLRLRRQGAAIGGLRQPAVCRTPYCGWFAIASSHCRQMHTSRTDAASAPDDSGASPWCGRSAMGWRRSRRSDRASGQMLPPAGYVLQRQRADRLERQIEPTMHLISHRARDADATHRARRLQPGRDVHASPCRSVPSGITSPMSMPTRKRMRDQEAGHRHRPAPVAAPSPHSAPRRRCCRIRSAESRHRSAPSCRRARGSPDRSVLPQSTQSPQCSDVVQPDQPAVAHHVGINHRDQLSAARCLLARSGPIPVVLTTGTLAQRRPSATTRAASPCVKSQGFMDSHF